MLYKQAWRIALGQSIWASDSLFGGSWSIENLRSTFDLKQKFDLLKVERNLHRLFDEKDVNDAVRFSADRGQLWS